MSLSFNGSFGDCEFQYEEDNTNVISLKQEDFKINFEEGFSQKFSNIKSINNNEFTINSNNIFNLVPTELELKNEYNNFNAFYDTQLSKELIKYHLANLFNIIKSKIIIKYSQVFHILKRLSSNKINNLISAEILYLKISGNLNQMSKIFSKKRKNILYQIFILLKKNVYISNDISENSYENFKNNFEIKYRNEKVKAINENNNSVKILEKDIKKIEKNIELLSDKERKLTNQINAFFKKEKLLTDEIKAIEKSNHTMKVAIQPSNLSSIDPNQKSNTEISSLESTIKNSEQLKKDKRDVINNFIEQVNNLLDEYQVYIQNINNINNRFSKDDNHKMII